MKEIKYFFLFLLIPFLSCETSDGGSDVVDPAEEQFLVIEANYSSPLALFTDIEQVSQRQSSTVILNKLIELIDATPEGASINLCVMAFDHKWLADALIRASSRGVNVSVMLDLSTEASELGNQPTIDALESGLEGNAEVILVNNDGRAIAINHNKFVLFSEVETTTGTEEGVVFQTSHNFAVSGTRKVQDAVMISDDGLYSAFSSYYDSMKEKAESGMVNYSYSEFSDPNKGLEAYFLPKRRNGEFYGDDSIIEILEDITDPSSTTIRIGMSLWTDTRTNIVEKLSELMDRGAKVEVIVKPSVGDNVFKGLQELEQKGAYLKAYTYTNIHSKFMLIDGEWRGEEAQVIITGSQNYTGNALRYNNEIILVINNSPMYDVYDEAYKKLKEVPR